MTKKGTFEKKKIQMETLPEYLKAARESFSYDLKHVAKITNISQKFLEYLENGYYHRLPADVYVYGFLRKLGELYRTDAEVLIYQYKKERGIHESLNRISGMQTYKSLTTPKFVLTPKTLTISSIVLLGVLVIGYLSYQVRAINKPPVIEIYEPADGEVVKTSSILVRGKTEAGAKLAMNDQDIFVDSSGEFKQLISVGPGQKVLTFVSRNNFGKESTKQISVIADLGTQAPIEPQKEPLTLIITAGPNPISITVQIDKNEAIADSLEIGQSKTYTAKDQILVSTGDAGSTTVEVNGKKFGKLGRDGEILQNIPFTIDTIK